ncbi:hypothetical protein ACIQVE_29360 [Pseudomonas sp. NPDC098747]|uniref:hypothetical protein n=1 Tax=Pseudomonas sp. NPDC098747 TaxID=3364487 RepID=UPI00383BC82F
MLPSDFHLNSEGYSLIGIVVCILIRIVQQWYHGQPVSTGCCVNALFNGTSIVPFILMIGGIFIPSWFDLAMASKLSMATAGGVGLVFVLGEVFSPKDLRKKTIADAA